MNKILIHTCCGDCVAKMLEALEREYEYKPHQLVLFFFNPNIHPESEWHARLEAVKAVAEQKQVEVIAQNWQPKRYFERLKMLRDLKMDVEIQTVRCPQCYELRLEETARYAAANDYAGFTSTMLTSTYLLTETVKIIGWQQSVIHNVPFLIPEKIDACMKTHGFYKQNYCGCIYSLKSRMEEKYL